MYLKVSMSVINLIFLFVCFFSQFSETAHVHKKVALEDVIVQLYTESFPHKANLFEQTSHTETFITMI